MDGLKQQISSEACDRLLKANLTYTDILTKGEVYLAQVTQLTLSETEHLISHVIKKYLRTTFYSAASISGWRRLSTGCESIDKIICGGVPVNGLTEIVGLSGVGKTQLCLQLSISVQLPVAFGGLGKSAVYICTEDLFPSKRLQQLSNVFGARYPQFGLQFMDNIFLEHISHYEQLRRCCIVRLPKLLQVHKVGLIVIDSIAGVFRSENENVNYSTRSEQFHIIASALAKLSTDYEIAVVNTNQVIDNLDTGKPEPCLGLAWSNLVTCRFWISRFSGNVRSFEVVFAPDLLNAKCKFEITESGLKDIHI